MGGWVSPIFRVRFGDHLVIYLIRCFPQGAVWGSRVGERVVNFEPKKRDENSTWEIEGFEPVFSRKLVP